jgi:hypothetical protein
MLWYRAAGFGFAESVLQRVADAEHDVGCAARCGSNSSSQAATGSNRRYRLENGMAQFNSVRHSVSARERVSVGACVIAEKRPPARRTGRARR